MGIRTWLLVVLLVAAPHGELVAQRAPDAPPREAPRREAPKGPAREKPAPPAKKPAQPRESPANCCKVCSKGKACGDACINKQLTCHKPPGCACNRGAD